MTKTNRENSDQKSQRRDERRKYVMLRKVSFGLIGLVILALYGVPYLLIGHIPSWSASFLFWLVAGLVIIALNAMATAGFKDNANFGGDER